MRVLLRKIRTAAQQPFPVLVCLPLAWVLLGLSRVMIRVLPFRVLAQTLGEPLDGQGWIPLATQRAEARARTLGRAIRLAASHTPWESTCLPQAITARLLLGLMRVPYSLQIGVPRQGSGPEGFGAHAWVRSGRIAVTGGESFEQFHVLRCYVGGVALPPPSQEHSRA